MTQTTLSQTMYQAGPQGGGFNGGAQQDPQNNGGSSAQQGAEDADLKRKSAPTQ